MKTPRPAWIPHLVLIAAMTWCASARAQSTAYWINGAPSEWNTDANWNIDLSGYAIVPGVGTNVDIGSATPATVNYNTPMAASSVGALSLINSTLDINAAGFNLDTAGTTTSPLNIGFPGAPGTLTVGSTGFLTTSNCGPVMINTDGSVIVAGNAIFTAANPTVTNASFNIATNGLLYINGGTLRIDTAGTGTVAPGGRIAVTNGTMSITGSANSTALLMGANNNAVGTSLSIDNSTVNIDRLLDIKGHASVVALYSGTLNCFGNSRISEQGNDRDSRIVVLGGTANLGNFNIDKSRSTGGLFVSNGVANATSLRIGTWNSQCYSAIYGGALTNTGAFYICDRTNGATSSDRRVRFLVRGGTVVSTSGEGIVIANQYNLGVGGSNIIGGILDMNAGTLIAEGITLVRDTTLTNAHAAMLLSGGSIYLGSVGLVGNVGAANSSYTITLAGGSLGAKANYAINANVNLSGTTPILLAADSAGTAHDITVNGILSGSGALNKAGAGRVTLTTNNTSSGNVVITAGTLALAATGSISNAPQIAISSGATFDVSAISGGYSLNNSRTLSGAGQVLGAVSAAGGSTINPGNALTNGNLTFQGNLTQNGGVLNHLDLTTNPTGNDLITINGDLTASGVNTLEIGGSVAASTVYPLIHYTGNFVGTLANFTLLGAAGSLSNNVSTKTIYLVTTAAIRGPTNATWIGNGSNNIWDVANTKDWLANSVVDYFVTGDNVRFDQTGAANPLVTIVGNVAPSAVTVDATANYTITGNGAIGGTGGLIKTNSGTLTLLSTNQYSGATILRGGWLEASTLRNNAIASSIGAAGTDPTNLVFDGGAFRYVGTSGSSSDRGATLNANATIDVPGTSGTLTMSGTVVGQGGLTKVGTGNLTLAGANTYSGVTTVSNGTLQINGAVTALGTNAVNLAGGTLFMNVGGQPTYSFEIDFLAPSGINVGGQNTIWVANSWFGTNATVNVNINTNGFFTFNDEFPTFSGTINLGTSDGILRFNAGGSSGGQQQCTGNSNVVFDLGTSYGILMNRNGGGDSFGTYYLGALAGAGSNTLLRGSANSGSGSTYQIGDLNLDTTFAGAIQNGTAGTSPPTPQLSAPTSINKVGTGKLTLTGANTYTGNTTISNGVLALSGSGSIAGSAAIRLVSPGILDVSGRTDGALVLAANQLVGGGTVRGSVIAGSGSTVSPGDQNFLFDGLYNQITVTNAFTLQSDSTLVMDIDLNAATNDFIQARTITYGGTLQLGVSGAFVVGNSVKLFNATSGYSGAFQIIIPPNPNADPSLVWDTSRLTVDGTIAVSVPHPIISSVVRSGTDLILSGTGGLPGGFYSMLTSTNLAIPLSQWTPTLTNQFDPIGNFSATNSITTGEPKRFFLIQIQP